MPFQLPDSPEERIQLVDSLKDRYRFLARKLDTDKRIEAREQIRQVLQQLSSVGMDHLLIDSWAPKELGNARRRRLESPTLHAAPEGKLLQFPNRRLR